MDTIFRYNMTGLPAPSPSEALKLYRADVNLHATTHSTKPFIFPYHLHGFFLLIAYLLIPHTKRPWLYAARWPLQILIWIMHFNTLMDSRDMEAMMRFSAGFVATYGMVITSHWLWWNAPQFEAKRFQMRVRRMGREGFVDGDDGVYGFASGVDGLVGGGRQRLIKPGDDQKKMSESQGDYEYYW